MVCACDVFRELLCLVSTNISHAGKDSMGRPIIVMIGAHLPAKKIDLERVMLYAVSTRFQLFPLFPVLGFRFRLCYVYVCFVLR